MPVAQESKTQPGPLSTYHAHDVLDDVFCDHCCPRRFIGAYVGKAQCKGCGKWKRVPLTSSLRQA